MPDQPRDEHGRFVEPEGVRRERIGREHAAFMAGVLSGPSMTPDGTATRPRTFWSTSSGTAHAAPADPTPHPPAPRPASRMEGGWRGPDSRAHVRLQEAEREAFLDSFIPYLTGRPRTAGKRYGYMPAVDPYAGDE